MVSTWVDHSLILHIANALVSGLTQLDDFLAGSAYEKSSNIPMKSCEMRKS